MRVLWFVRAHHNHPLSPHRPEKTMRMRLRQRPSPLLRLAALVFLASAAASRNEAVSGLRGLAEPAEGSALSAETHDGEGEK